MLYNPSILRLTDAERTAVLKHEYYIIFLHVTDRMPGGKMTKMWNIATDLAINSNISDLPKGTLFPVMPHLNLCRYKSAEWYMESLKDMAEESDGESSSDGEGTPGDNGAVMAYRTH